MPSTPASIPKSPKVKDKDKNHIALQLLSRAHSPDHTTQIFTEKVKLRPLHLKPTAATHTSDSREYRRQQRLLKISKRKRALKPQPLSAKERRALGIYDIPRKQQKYALYAPLNLLWIGYIQEILGLKEGVTFVDSSSAAKLVSADYHGAELEIVRSRCVSRVGVKGIVIKDSKFTFEIVTKNDEVKIVPKEHTIFKFEVPRPGNRIDETDLGAADMVNQIGGLQSGIESKPAGLARHLIFELHGDQFQHRASDRANKKFKSHFLPDL